MTPIWSFLRGAGGSIGLSAQNKMNDFMATNEAGRLAAQTAIEIQQKQLTILGSFEKPLKEVVNTISNIERAIFNFIM